MNRGDVYDLLGSPTVRVAPGVVTRVDAAGVAFASLGSLDPALEFQVKYAGEPPTPTASCLVAIATDTTEAWLLSWDGPRRPLTPVAKVATYTAVDGDYVEATGSFTVTLPEPVAGRRVGVVAMTASAVSPMLVHTPTGLIKGLGVGTPAFSGAADIYLGVPGANATLLADGTNWHVIAGGQDTGWLSLTPYLFASWSDFGAGYQASGFRKDALGQVRLRGLVKYVTPGSYASFAFATLPTGWRPAVRDQYNVQGGATSWSFAPFCLEIDAAGVMTLLAPTGGNNASASHVSLAGVEFPAA